MNILFPCNPLEPREVDPDFAEQAAAAAAVGFSTWLLSFEALVHDHAPSRAVRRIPEDTGPCLYRGWMLKPPAYAELAGALEARRTPLVVTPAAYAYAHQLPEWFNDVREVTAATEWTSSGDLDQARAALGRLPPGPAIVKDYVKSAKHRWREACFIPDTRDVLHALAVIRAFLEEQGSDLNGGVVLRAFRPYPTLGTDERTGMPVIEERRVFVWRGRPVEVRGDEGALLGDRRLATALGRVRSPFVSVDLARLDDGSWEVVEIGDGQVSGLRETDPFAFFRALVGAVGLEPTVGGIKIR